MKVEQYIYNLLTEIDGVESVKPNALPSIDELPSILYSIASKLIENTFKGGAVLGTRLRLEIRTQSYGSLCEIHTAILNRIRQDGNLISHNLAGEDFDAETDIYYRALNVTVGIGS